MGLKLIASKISDCLLDNCLGELAQFYGSKFKNTRFQNCKLRNADFRACDLSSTAFFNCDLGGAEFYDANLQGTDFRGSDISQIKIQPKDLKGAVIDANQAMELGQYFAKLLEIEVSEG
jgi:uncharacterized protein YjbI with pentapeptide repeats